MAKVLSSISGNLISAASAGYAPTNSAEVSAIASAYQVVSATGTQLYAGTAHVTSINSAPLSASRAGNAANASMANSAYYDGTGRLISSLPDSATVSAIAESYAESAASGKLDTTAQVVTSTAGDGVYVTAINGMGISGEGGGGAQVVTATGSASATEGFWPVTTSYLVSAINGSALLPYGYSILSANSANWTNARTVVTAHSAEWNSVYNTVSSNSAGWTGSTGGGGVVTATGSASATAGTPWSPITTYFVSSINGSALLPYGYSVLSGNSAKWNWASSAVSANSAKWNSAYNTVSNNSASWGQGGVDSATVSAIASAYQVVSSTASGSGEIFGQTAYYATEINGLTLSAQEAALANYATNAGSAGAAPTNSSEVSAIASSYASGKADASALSSYALSADVSSTIDTVSSNSASWGGGGAAFPAEIVTASNVRAVVTTGFQDNTATRPTLFISSNPTYNSYPRMLLSENHATTGKSGAFLADAFEFYEGTGFKVFRADPAAISAIKFFLGSAKVYGSNWILTSGSVSGGNTTSNWFLNRNWVSGISGTATWQYGTAEYNKLTSVHDTVSSNSASWGAGGVPESTVSSIASSYAESAVSSVSGNYAQSADVSATVDLVSTQSANWGGSALALSAGPGVKLEKVGTTLVASVDGPLHRQETLAGYWNGSAVYQQFISGTATSNGNTNFTIPTEITGTNIVNKWIDPSNSFIYYNTTSNALPISWCMGSGRYGSVGFVGGVINYRCIDTSPTTITAYIALKYMKA